MIGETVRWEPILGTAGLLTGAKLDGAFARSCMKVPLTSDVHSRAEQYVWRITKPADWHRDYIPSEIFTYYEDSLLLSAVYMRHGGESGKWLNLDQTSWGIVGRQNAIYSYHHAEAHDQRANRWLQFAFSRWVQFAEMVLE